MRNTVSFKKKLIASAVASIASFSSVAFAQNADTTEEVVVTGIRASLTKSMDIKREAAGVVDAISAEDIGKMPDANLAESLQRIPGVSIDRSNGEGSKVTVRGLAGDYNLVTLNGRQMPASTVGNGGASASRSFDFANLASEGIAGVEVYKTGRADVDSGGMGALINVTTPHPLKNPGLKATVGVKAVDDTSADGTKITPEISGLYSNTFADDTIGIALTGSYQDRKFGDANANVSGGWLTVAPDGADWGGPQIAPSARPTDPNVTYSVPANFGYNFSQSERKRTNGQLTLQYKPVEQLVATLDYLYVNQTVDKESHYGGVWFYRDAATTNIQWSKGQVAYPMVYNETRYPGQDYDVGASISNRKSDLGSTGINLQWEASDRLKIEVDAHNSISHAGPNSPYGTENSFDAAVLHRYTASVDFKKEVPELQLVSVADANDPVTGKPVADGLPVPNAANSQLTGNTWKRSTQNSAVNEQQIKAEYTFDDSALKSIKAGWGRIEDSNTSIWMGHSMENQGSWSGVGKVGDIPAEFWPVDRWSNHFSHSFGSNFQDQFVYVDFKKLTAEGAKLYGVDTATTASPCPRSYCTVDDPDLANDGFNDYRTTEKTDSGFLQGKFETDFNGMPVHILAGLRYEHTSVDSKSLLTSYSPLVRWNGGNEYSLVPEGGYNFFSGRGGYHELLPSFDYDIGLTDTIKARASFSKTMARPNYYDIRGGFAWDSSPRYASGTASSGNPDLNPLLSTNYDLSVEWYYDESSYVSVGYFKKNLTDFIGSQTVVLKNTPFHTPYNGQRWQDAVNAGKTTLDDIRDYIIAHADPATVDAAGKKVFGTADDPVLPFNVTQPVNNKDATIHGFELAIQHNFGETGFGVMANFTKVYSDAEYDNASYSTQFAILGLSDSANLVAFYDKNDIQARLAYNWRDKFLAGTGSNPTYVDSYGQLDGSIGYKLTDNLTVSFEGLNILNATTRSYAREWHELLNYTETGARYNLGVKYTF